MKKQQVAPFERVVAEHGAAVLRVCNSILGPGADAQDAWSETFLAALSAYPDLAPGANVQGWLVRIAHNKAVDLIRAASRRAVPAAELPEGESAIGIPAAPDDTVWRALASLPFKQRQAVAYHHVAGLPHADVAAILGGTPTAARKAASDGMKSLRTLLDPKDR
ncbi:RNA polymerase sigma factor [Paeniglutamicibacter cryotolerans]|uniref:RNA polymerase sigma factor (Sigma-70 family) n=1 Tax=Paeniglutamicibacter cryotolerans TaxID=670079 RepID=A0A839QU16_9MICC|nr:RNA polymerase sigma factor [Paeniglutamicibacter cryotolerans]MBB2995521.1 RNA polymerase sigma factor (sigma-70 family) [Paeniglutamicibacter cryotolerans]